MSETKSGRSMIRRLQKRFSLVLVHLRLRQHIEAYAVFLLGIILAVLGVFQTADTSILLAGILVGVSYLVFHSSSSTSENCEVSLDQVLRDRTGFSPIREVIAQAKDLRVYGPTAVNLLIHSADIKRYILQAGGSVRIIVQNPASESGLKSASRQLDSSIDFAQALRTSVDALRRLSASGDIRYKFLESTPGFSILQVNADSADGYIILELHGYSDENISDRMHLRIDRTASPRWYWYWSNAFETLWIDAAEPGVRGSE